MANSSPVIVAPEIERYAPEVQSRAADELASLPPPCPRTHIIADCSAIKLLVNDYGTMRERVRAVK